MDSDGLISYLSDLPIGPLRFFERIDSTNSEAARWVAADAPDLALVVADEQTAGRGRRGRTWFTPPGAALAFSLVLRSALGKISAIDQTSFSNALAMRLTALGALSVSQTLRMNYALLSEIKWPNDVLLERRKVAGILVEASWRGDQLEAAILGIGINIAPDSIPVDTEQTYPATCVQNVVGRQVDRLELLHAVLENLLKWRTCIASPDFLTAWDQSLAFKGEWVSIFDGDHAGSASRQGFVLGLDDQGWLRLKDRSGKEFTLLTGELRLRPAVG